MKDRKNKTVFIIAGEKKAGKSELLMFIKKELLNVIIINYRDKLSNIADKMGWRDIPNNDKTESLLDDIYYLWKNYNDGLAKQTYNDLINSGINDSNTKANYIIVVRSSNDIIDLKSYIKDYNIVTVLVYRNTITNFNKQLNNFNYDYIINNTSDLKNLKREANSFMIKYMKNFNRFDSKPIVKRKTIEKNVRKDRSRNSK